MTTIERVITGWKDLLSSGNKFHTGDLLGLAGSPSLAQEIYSLLNDVAARFGFIDVEEVSTTCGCKLCVKFLDAAIEQHQFQIN